ncbi:MAG: DUF3379 domain-containing protein [Proteobacteria bacterium]|nr:DUF3379 domain-containing protein [Pseudomonadota bacterium]
MNYFEFKQQLLKDPFTKNEEFHRLRKQDVRCEQAYQEAIEFEKTLKQAIKIKIPANLKDSVILRQATTHAINTSIKKYALAATILLTFIIVSATWYIKQPGPIEAFVIESLAMKPEDYMSHDVLPQAQVQELFASLNSKIDGNLGNVHFMKICSAPGGKGARMVLMTDTGPVTILYMPDANLNQRLELELDKYQGSVIALEKGAAAIIGANKQQLALVENQLHGSIRPLAASDK